MTNLEKRYSKAIKEIGGSPGLMSLPEQVKTILKQTNNLEYKVRMLERIVKDRRE